ncbi:MAG TPA: SigE family RNA polymerase sigma factor [Streptosporangiaceae bacterium]
MSGGGDHSMAEGCKVSRRPGPREAAGDQGGDSAGQPGGSSAQPGSTAGGPGQPPGGDAGQSGRGPGQVAGAGEIFRHSAEVPRARSSATQDGGTPTAMPGRSSGRRLGDAGQLAASQRSPGQRPRGTGIDDPAFREYVTARRRSLLRTAYLLTGNVADAEDLVQSALAKTYSAWDRIEDMGALDGYVRRAIVNTHISWWRGRRMEELPTDEIPDQAVADHAAGSDLQHTMRQAVDRLPERMRAAVLLRYYEDMTEAEVAEVLGVSLGTVKSTVARAVAKLRVDAELHSE